MDYKRLGPFEIIKKIRDLAYKLKLPRTYQIHPVISASRLEKAKPDEWNRPIPQVTLKVCDPKTGEHINRILPVNNIEIGFQTLEGHNEFPTNEKQWKKYDNIWKRWKNPKSIEDE